MALDQIEALAKEHAADRALLAERVEALNSDVDALKARRLAGIKFALGRAKDSRIRLQSAIEQSRLDFTSPRTRVFHGIKVGIAKGKGALTFASAASVVALIKKHFADKARVLIKTEETPVKKALQRLSVTELQKIGCTVTATGDFVVLTPVDTEVDKMVAALLATVTEELKEEEPA